MTYQQLEQSAFCRVERERDVARVVAYHLAQHLDDVRHLSGLDCPICGATWNRAHTPGCWVSQAREYYPAEQVGGAE